MKKKVNWSILLAVVALVVLLAVGTVGAQEGIPGEIEPELEPGEIEPELEPEPEAGEAAEAEEAGPYEGGSIDQDQDKPCNKKRHNEFSVRAALQGSAVFLKV